MFLTAYFVTLLTPSYLNDHFYKFCIFVFRLLLFCIHKQFIGEVLAMKNPAKRILGSYYSRSGFTLIELLIVIIVLGILAMIIIPQITVSSEDAKISACQSQLATMRSAIELYYHQHENVYPGGVKTDGTPMDTAANAAIAFVQQLTRYTEVDGTVSTTKTVDAKFGPYIKGTNLATNPFNDLNTVVCDILNADITVKASSGTAGWKFYILTGVLLANDGAHDSY